MAEAIVDEEYRGVRDQFEPVEITDDGKAWALDVMPKGRRYGGGRSFKIDKCGGAITEIEISE